MMGGGRRGIQNRSYKEDGWGKGGRLYSAVGKSLAGLTASHPDWRGCGTRPQPCVPTCPPPLRSEVS